MRTTVALLVGMLWQHSSATGQVVPSYGTATSPVVSVGVESGAEPYLLSGVADAMRLADGSIIIGHCSTSELRIYDPNGLHVRSVGGEGQGPGEFQYIKRLFGAGGDSIAVYDGFPNRVSIFRTDGTFVRSIRLPVRAEAVGRTSDGAFVLVQPALYRNPAPSLAGGFHRLSTVLYTTSGEGVLIDSLAGLPGTEIVMVPGDRVPVRAPRFRRMAVIGVHPTSVIFGTQDLGSFDEISSNLRNRVARPTITAPLPVTAALREEWEDTRPVLAPRGGVTPVFAEVYSPATPAYRDVIAGNDGRTWIQDPELPGEYPLVWTAYSEGRAMARVELPPRFFPFEFGTGWVLGVGYDGLGIERVQLLSLIPQKRTGSRLSPREAAPPNTPRCGSWTSR